MRKATKDQLSDYFRILSRKSKEAKIKKYGIAGFHAMMKRMSDKAKEKRDKKINGKNNL